MRYKKKFQPALFPEHWLDQHIHDPHWAAPIIGGLFEGLTASLFNGRRLAVDCSEEMCPDVSCHPFLFMESKASCRECFVTKSKQFENYKRKSEEELIDTDYILWGYRRVEMKGRTVRETLLRMSSSIQFLLVLPLKVVGALIDRSSKKYYIQGRQGGYQNHPGYGQKVGYYRLTRKVWGPLLDSPVLCFIESLGLDPKDYWAEYKNPTASVRMYGQQFKSNVFKMVRIHRVLPF